MKRLKDVVQTDKKQSTGKRRYEICKSRNRTILTQRDTPEKKRIFCEITEHQIKITWNEEEEMVEGKKIILEIEEAINKMNVAKHQGQMRWRQQ